MLMEYNGAVILISHDRHLIEATADRLWLVRNGAVKPALVERLGQRLREAVTFEMELARALRQDVTSASSLRPFHGLKRRAGGFRSPVSGSDGAGAHPVH